MTSDVLRRRLSRSATVVETLFSWRGLWGASRHPWWHSACRFLLCRDDRFFPADFQRRGAAERLGLTADEMEGGHLPALARPAELAARLPACWTDADPE